MALTKKTIEQTCLIEIRRGERVKEKGAFGREGRVVDFRLVPNGMQDHTLICLLVVELPNGGRVVSGVSRWEPLPETFYLECYPSMLLDVAEIQVETEPAQKGNGKQTQEIMNPIAMLEV